MPLGAASALAAEQVEAAGCARVVLLDGDGEGEVGGSEADPEDVVDVALATRTQGTAVDLADPGPRQGLAEDELVGALVLGEPAVPQVAAEVDGPQPGVSTRDDVRTDPFAEVVVVDADDGDVVDVGVGQEMVLDLLGRDLLPAAVDLVLEAADDGEVAVRPLDDDVAGAVLYLSSSAASYVTGSVLAVDGGFLSA